MSRQNSLTPHQKLSLGVVIVIGLTTLVFGLFQIRRSIIEPLEIKNRANFKTPAEVEEERIANLKLQDTDSDSLNDYDELYLFRTSPFLADSDSDGINDGTEVANSSNPNCPQGSNCLMARTNDSGTGATTTSTPPNLAPDQESVSLAMDRVFGDLDELTPETMMERLNSLQPAELRQFMLDIGAPAELIDQADDNMLKQIFQETMGAMSENESSGDTLEEVTP
ncbi:MAG: hypothetical protein V1738_06160 [Patescibacteria group bacterium]